MKKTLAILLMLVIFVGALSGCGQNSNPGISQETGLPENVNGIDAAKLILANERLNSQLFKSTDSIFMSGAAVFDNLYNKAEENMVKYSGAGDKVEVLNVSNNYSSDTVLSLSSSDNKNYTLSNGSTLEIDGNLYKWGNFGEYSNSYDYFLNLTNNVKASAEIGARLIDDTKKYVRIVDTWVRIDANEYYLHVEDDTEIIYCRSEYQEEMCRRYKRADGVNVYEIYKKNSSGGSSRMEYVPGEKYEYSYIYNDFNHNFLAENTKGFWEVVDVGRTDWGYNVSCMVLKDDICYDSLYDPKTGEINGIKVISPDKKTDILDIFLYESGASISLKLQAFNGVDHIRLETDKVVSLDGNDVRDGKFVYRYDVPENPKQKEHTVYFAGTNSCTLVLDNGAFINDNDSFLDGAVTINGVHADYVSMEGYVDGYIGVMEMNVKGNTYDEVMDTLEEFLDVVGLECTRNFNGVRSGITQACTELAQMTKYHCWNESPIRSDETLNAGYENNLAKHASYSDMLAAVKDAEVVDWNNREEIELKIKFAPITSQTAAEVKNDGLSVVVKDLQLSVEDTTLFVVGEKYKVNFAIIGVSENSDAGLTHIDLGEAESVKYEDEDVFTVGQNASFEIPVLSAGEYTVVAYLSTEDGIRSSGYQNVIFTDVSRYESKIGSVNVVIDKKQNGELSVSVTEMSDIEVDVELSENTTHTYSDMFSALEEKAYLYGFVDDESLLDVSADGGATWAPLTGNELSLVGGLYRLKYSIRNGTVTSEGYVYTNYTT